MRNAISITTLAVVALAGCNSAPPAPAKPDEAAIRTALSAQEAKFGPLMQNKDAAGMAAVFTDDATWILPDASTFAGKAAIQAGAKGFADGLDSFVPESSAIDKLVVINDSEALTFSHEIGTIKMKGKGQKAERHNNAFADYWKKGADGTWRIAYEVNADGPLPAAAPAAAPAKP